MKCTDKGRLRHDCPKYVRKFGALAVSTMLLVSGCGTKTYEFEHPYDVYGTSMHYIQSQAEEGSPDVSKTDTAAGKMHPQLKPQVFFTLRKAQLHMPKIFMKNYIRRVQQKY